MRRQDAGFTLVEAITAIVVMAIAVPASFWAIRDAGAARAAPVRASTARWLASEKLEDIIADRHSVNRGYTYIINANYAAEPAVTGFTSFARSVAINETAVDLVSAGTGYKRVIVTVSWSDQAGPHSLEATTVLTDY